MVEFFKDNKYYKWIGIIDEKLDKNLYSLNLFNNYIDISNNLAYIIPFRNRQENLDETINGLKNYIQCQNLEADIWVVEQNQFGNWNKGTTCNCGFNILKNYYQYFVFNDADTYSKLNNKFIYPSKNEINHIYGYHYCLGGIFSCDKDTFIKINGFNNNFFNWGREDRDLEDRCIKHNVDINRSNLIKLNHTSNKVKQLEHDNANNYWNFKEENKEFYQARELYYLNQIQHMKKEFDNGLSSLVSDSSVENNRKVVILINLKKWTQGVITILSFNKELFQINTLPQLDTGLIKSNTMIKK